MTESVNDSGVIQALVARFEKYRLPRVLELQEKVDGGGLLDDRELDYLERVIHEALQNRVLADRYPEWRAVSSRVTILYNEITTRALQNEKGRQPLARHLHTSCSKPLNLGNQFGGLVLRQFYPKTH